MSGKMDHPTHAEQASMEPEFIEEIDDEPSVDSPFLVVVSADDEGEREAMAWALDDEGFLVKECEDRSELKSLLRPAIKNEQADDPADVIVADEHAVELLFKFRRAERGTPIVLIADGNDSEILDIADDLDARILPTPFSADDLIDAVRAAIAAALADS